MLFFYLESHDGSSSWVKTKILIAACKALHGLHPIPTSLIAFCIFLSQLILLVFLLLLKQTRHFLDFPLAILDAWCLISELLPLSFCSSDPTMRHILNITSTTLILPSLIYLFFCPEYLSHSKISYNLLYLQLACRLYKDSDFPSSSVPYTSQVPRTVPDT